MASNVGSPCLKDLKIGSRLSIVPKARGRSERGKYSRLMPELKAQLQTERFGRRKVGTDLVAPCCKEGPGSGSLGSEPGGWEPSGFVRQESDGELRGIVKRGFWTGSWYG